MFGEDFFASGEFVATAHWEMIVPYSDFPFALRHAAHRAFCAATIRLRAAGDIVRPFRAPMEVTLCPLILAHRARCAEAMRARPAAETVLPVRWLVAPFSNERARSMPATRVLRRLRSCLRSLSADVKVVIARY